MVFNSGQLDEFNLIKKFHEVYALLCLNEAESNLLFMGGEEESICKIYVFITLKLKHEIKNLRQIK
jgi:hypothetical protein